MTSNIHEEAELRHWLVDYLVTNFGCNPDDIDADLPLNTLGVGSRDAVVLSGELAEMLGRQISPVEFWQHPTINALAEFLSAPEPESGPDRVPTHADRGSLDEPIAVIGLGCRFPGGIGGPEALWQFLRERRSSVSEVPGDRWRQFDDGSPEVAAALARTTRWGSFLDEIDTFDAEFFDISPSEAAHLDPQQRLLLEVAYEALEHAGIPASSLRRTQTGVFAGACLSEYGYVASRDLSQVDAWTGTGGALSVIANRLSYFLDVRGPSVVVDTACSSSLVAVHLACQSLRTGESHLAIAAGVNLLLSPAVTHSFDQADAMSPTGGCHAFDAAADGFVRGEGCGVVVLKRLSDAQRDGDRVLAVVRGSAVNQDGRSNGLMAPNPAAQIAVLRTACANAGVQPREVDYVEAHGTGTLLGDPIEARALGRVFGRGRPESSPLLIGAIKTNLGHLEAAAGIAGLIKATLAVQSGHIPPNQHFETPNPHIPFHEMRLKVVAEHLDWPVSDEGGGRPRRAGVSSFGFGGTNAHVVVEQAPDQVVVAPEVDSPAVCTLVVSGKTVQRVGSWAGVLADWLAGPGAQIPLTDVAHTVNHHRARHPRFATVCARDHTEAVAGLRALASGQPAVGVVAPHEGPCAPGTVFVYSGQGSQWAGMARQLLADEPAFATAVAELEPVFVAEAGFSLHEVLAGGQPVGGIDRIQPVLVATQLALTTLWRCYGVEPDAVIGHSMGEVTAAVVAGALTPAEGLHVITTRSRLMARLSGQGAMALLELDAAATATLITDYPQVSVAVHASPRQTVIAGPPEHIDALIAIVSAQDRLARRIDVDVASHHQIIDPILPELRSALHELTPKPPTIPIITTVEDANPTTLFDADHWAANLRNPVRFNDAITTAATEHATFIEISPHPLLTHAITDTLGQTHHHTIPTLLRDTHDTLTFHTHLNTTHTTHPPHTDHPPEPHPTIPTTPWHHTHHWITTKETATASGSVPRPGTLLGQHITVSSKPPGHLWQARLVPEAKPYPGSHRLHGVEVVPISVLLQTMLVAAAELGAPALSDVRFEHPIVVDRPKFIQVVADHESVSVASSSAVDAAADRWTSHATAQLSTFVADPAAPGTANPDGETLNGAAESIAELLQARGVEGRPFTWSIDSCRSTSSGLVARVGLAEESTVALLDAAVHIAPLAGATDTRLYVPAAIGHVWVDGALTQRHGSVSVHRTGGGADEVIVDIDVATDADAPCISLRSLRYAALEPSAEPTGTPHGDPRGFAHTIDWLPRLDQGDAPAADRSGTVAVVGGETRSADELLARLTDAGYAAGGLADARYVLYVADAEPADHTERDIDCAVRLAADVTDLVRQLAEREERDPATLWVLTTGVREAAQPAAVRQSCLWGLAGVISAEHPEIWGGLVDLAARHDITETASALARVLRTPSKSVLVLRDGVFHAPELVPGAGEPVRDALRCRPDAAYLITGGLGALGLLMAAWLAELGARRLLLAGRTPLPSREDWDGDIADGQARARITAVRELEKRGVSVEVLPLDIGSRDDVQALLARRNRDGAPPIRGVIHAAGMTHSQLIRSTTDDSMRDVMWPKISGAQVLHEAFPCGSVDFFFLTASAGAVFGVPGQGAYAAANAYLDALARARHHQGCHTVSFDWVAWQGLGFASDAQLVAQELHRLGSRELTPQEAFLAWEHVHTRDIAQAVVVPVPPPAGQGAATGSDGPTATQTATMWTQMRATDVQDELIAKIRTIAARELRMAESEVETARPFVELGLNSMMALSIRREIEQLVGLELSATMLWNHPTVESLSVYLAKKLAPQEETLVDAVDELSGPTGSAGHVVRPYPIEPRRQRDQDLTRTAFGQMSGMTDEQRAALIDEFDAASRMAVAEPVAVVGIGCRFPGDVVGPESFWRLLVDGRDAVGEVPADRWDADAFYDPDPLAPGRMTTKWGGFVSDVAGFDAEFFGITPREAEAMDPQQRMLLEVAWEALEHAGMPPDSLSGSRTGVMMGVYYNEYQSLSARSPETVSAYTGTGNAHSVTVGRISYLLGLRGPAVAVDTACSSSLVAVHLACQSLRLRESDVALAGGVNVILRPETQIAISAWGLLSAEGRCKTFDAGADGFVRGEGCGVAVLKRLVDAVRDGDRVLAVVRGSAINQDGRSNGVTAPSAPAQRDVIIDALRAGDVDAGSVDYVESHGTATILGDPIEFEALAETYGHGNNPCALGSSKTNLGHLEAAAGIAGFIKAILAVQHAQIPPNLHFSQWNPAIDPAPTRFFVPTEAAPWPADEHPRRAAVSSFGFGGTNAHVVLEQGPDSCASAAPGTAPAVSTLVVSGKTAERVASTAATLADWMQGAGAQVPLAGIAHTLNHHRSRHAAFGTVCGADHHEAVAGLRALASGQPAAGVVAPHEGPCRLGTVFVYSGQGSQWAGMGRKLMADEPAFAAALAELEPVFVKEIGFSLRDVLANGESVDGSVRVQSVLVGMQLALTALWRSYGVEPDALIGHSVGEITAAVVGGALTVAEGLRVVAARSRLMAQLAGQGAVALVELDTQSTAALIADHPQVSVTVYASPRQTVIAGPTEAIDTLIATARQQNTFARRVNMEVASHHAMMDPVLPELRAALAGLAPKVARIPVLTTVENASATTLFDADHWVNNLRNPVRFAQAIATAGADHATFIEVSPHPVLTKAVSDTLVGVHHHSLGTLQRDTNDTVAFHTNLNATHTTQPPDTDHPSEPHPAIPSTPWHHTHHWISAALVLPQPVHTHSENGRAITGPLGPSTSTAGQAIPADWLYEPTWAVRALPTSDSPRDGRWVVFGDAELGTELGRVLESRVTVLPAAVVEDDADRPLLLQAINTADHVLYAPAVTGAQIDVAAAYRLFNGARRLSAALAALAAPPRLFIVTRNAQPVAEGDRANPSHAALWGLGRTLALEHPEIWGGIVDLDESVPAELTAQCVAAEASTNDDEDQVVYRRGARHVPRLKRRNPPTRSVGLLGDDTSHLVIGATGNIGPHLIQQLADMGAGTIVAVARHPGSRLHELAGRLSSTGTRLVEIAADAADDVAMTALFDRFGADLPALEGIYLAGFAGGPVTLRDMADDDVNTMFRPKLDAASLVHTLSLKTAVRQFVLFSSISGLLGSRWLAHYAATSNFLDTLAYARRALGLPAAVVNWGVWKSLADVQHDAKQVTSDSGLTPMPDEVAIRALPLAMSPDAPVRSTVVDADWPLLAAAYRTRGSLRIVDDLLPAADATPATTESEFRKALRECAPGRRRNLLVDHVTGLASAVMGLPPSEILDPSMGFFQLGMDSLMTVTLARGLSETLGEELTPAAVFDYPTVEALTDHLTTILPEMAEADRSVADAYEHFTEAESLQTSPKARLIASTETPDRRAPITDALRKIDERSARLANAEQAATEPIAVVGMACRFPGGVNNPEQYWELLQAGRSGIVRVPPERWDADMYYTDDHTVPGTICNREGGFLTSWQPDEFDAEFFAISPREAAAMDPQQRLLLEVAYEALEDAGIPPQAIRGTQTGVFVGLTSYDYMLTLSAQLQPEDLDAYIPTGNAANFAAGRLAYYLGARGPALVVDSACSSSLVAIHLACQSLRWRESDTALIGGTNLILSPGTSIACSRWGMLSPDGQCKTFDAAADGYVRSEGCGVVVLKRLSDAQRDGDRVLAVVRGSAVNQDGASSGVTVPNGPAQQALLRQALSSSKLAPADIDYVEAHGTGTPLGDPIELEALSQVFSDRGDSPPLVLGSVKTNLGHLEAAAGVAGFMKTVLAVRNGHIPQHLNFSELTPHATEAASCLNIASSAQQWPVSDEGGGRPRRAGVSSFGVSGTNAHVVVEQAPDQVVVAPEVDSPAVCTLVVSGKTVQRVGSWAGVLADWLAGPGAQIPLTDVAHTVNHHRARHPRFATVCARDHTEAVAGLRALASGQPAVGVVAPHEGPCAPGTVFVYSGQGSQWAGMARQLLADEPAFATAVAELEPVFVAEAGFSLHEVLAGGQPVGGIDRIQPVLVATQLALTTLWRCYGVEPDAVIGHSMGEVTAAVVAGALTPAEGLHVIATRSRLMARLSGQGAMALLELDAAATATLITDYPQVSVAVHASPRQTVIAGPPEHIDALIAIVSAQDRLARRIDVDVASHHRIIDPILPELRSALHGLTPKPPTIPIITTVEDANPTTLFDADHWAANLRNPVRFNDAITTAATEHATFIEISPHPLLTHAITDTLGQTHHHTIPTLLRDTHDTLTFHTHLNTTHTTHPPHTDHPPEPHPTIPTTPWHHTHHWITTTPTTPLGTHPLLGIGVTDPTNGTRVWESTLGPDVLWLGDHRVDDACVLPGAAYAELALAAATDTFGGDEPWTIRELCLDQVMHIADETVVVTTLSGDEAKPRVEIRSRNTRSGWTVHASATLERGGHSRPEPPLAVDDTPSAELDPDELYRRLRSAGQMHGPAFQGIVGLTVSGTGVARAAVRLPSAAKPGSRRFLLHPVMVDVALQALGATKAATDLATQETDEPAVVLPVRLAGVRAYGDVTEGVCAVGSLRATSRPDRFVGQVHLIGPDGQVLLEIDEIEMVLLQAPGPARVLTSRLFALEWEPVELDKPAGAAGALLLVGDPAAADPLLTTLRSGAAEQTALCEVVSAGDTPQLRNELTRKDIEWDGVVVVCPPRAVDEELPDRDQLELAQSRTLLIADIVKTLSQIGARNSPRLWIVTRGAQQVNTADRVTLAQTELRGIARVLTFEHPELRTTIVDVDAEGTGSHSALTAELLAGADHDEVALRDGQRYVHRLAPASTTATGDLEPEPRRTVVNLDGIGAVRLQVDQPGRLDALTVHAVKRIPPEDDQVEIRVIAAGLNFSDVLKTMGVYPGLDGSAPVIGGECVGIVSAVGANVDSVEIGMRVIAFGPGTFGTHLTTLADLVVPIPDALPDLEAATFGVAYLTAWHSLCEVGRLARGERVLIHSATGGVGLAAVSIARMIGARIYATAGSDAKRELLTGLGVEYVGDSRSVDFADEILDVTDGYGADVILNSLPGEAIRRGVQVLAPGGRFVELGKKDVYADSILGLAALAKSGSFSVVDLDLNLRLQPERYRRLLEDILQHVADGKLRVLPVTEFTLDDAVEAFRLMASGSHTGKIVISIPAVGSVEAVAPPPPQPLVRSDGGYIVVGGMGGLGFVVARWLVAQGAGMVVLNGRSAPGADVSAAIADMNAEGTRVAVHTGDIAESGTAERLVAAVEDAGLRLAGVLHSATVLADEIVLNMSASAAARVFAPKVAGSWRLHEATEHLDLDWWLTFSSAASLLGSPGQGAYAAANSWVDGLVAYRRSLGLPAIGINWGPWAEVGRAQFFADLGFSMITAEQGLAAMQVVLAADRSRTGVFSLDARQWFQSFPAAEESSLFAKLGSSTTVERHGDGRIRTELDAADPAERPARLASAIADEIRAVLRSAESLDHELAMESLGLDSLMALELRNRLEGSLGITLPVALVWAYPTISGLAAALCERMGYAPTEGPPRDVPAPEPALSDEDIDLLADLVDASELEATREAGES